LVSIKIRGFRASGQKKLKIFTSCPYFLPETSFYALPGVWLCHIFLTFLRKFFGVGREIEWSKIVFLLGFIEIYIKSVSVWGTGLFPINPSPHSSTLFSKTIENIGVF